MKILAILALIGVVCSKPNIKHVVVLMEENRSFDHFFGFASRVLGTDGLTGDETNPVSTTDPNSPRVKVASDSPYIGLCDPDHSTDATTSKIFGLKAVIAGNLTDPTMDGFIEFEGHRGHSKLDYCGVMNMFTPSRLPVLTTLAKEFAVFDRYFASHPGPTWPNRFFALMATSVGCTETGTWYLDKAGNHYPHKTLFDLLEENGKTWANYYADSPWEVQIASIAKHPENILDMERFHEDVRTGTLPTFSWLNPRSGIDIATKQGSNDQHPDHDVRLGEGLIKSVYESLRAGPAWNETVLVVMYDEHGGFYDHVPTPIHGIPAPDNSRSYPDKFDFKRLGVRLPFVVASPLIPAGTIVHEPPHAQAPTATSQYDATSVAATIRKLFDLSGDFLSDREAWTGTWEHIFSLSEPRATPRTLPPAPTTLSDKDAAAEAAMPLNSLQHNILDVWTGHHGVHRPNITAQGDLGKWFKHAVQLHRNGPSAVGELLTVSVTSSDTAMEPSTGAPGPFKVYKHSHDPVTGCLSCGRCTIGSELSVVPCDASQHSQSFQLTDSHMVVWGPHPSYCMTVANIYAPQNLPVTLQNCNSSVTQHFDYGGGKSGMGVGSFFLHLA